MFSQEGTQDSSRPLTPIRVLVPGTGPRFRCGGLSVALQTARLLSQLRPTEVVTYRAREQSHLFLDDLLHQEDAPGDAHVFRVRSLRAKGSSRLPSNYVRRLQQTIR